MLGIDSPFSTFFFQTFPAAEADFKIEDWASDCM